MKNPEAYADVVIRTIKLAITPLLERIAVSEQCNRDLQQRVETITEIRDRLITIETKAGLVASPPDPTNDIPSVLKIALGPVQEQVAAQAAQIADLSRRAADDSFTKELGALRERVAVVEVKPEPPPVVDLEPILTRVSVVESALTLKADAADVPVVGSVVDLAKADEALRAEIDAINADRLSADAITEHTTALLRKSFSTRMPVVLPSRTKKVVMRDRQGRIEEIREVPV